MRNYSIEIEKMIKLFWHRDQRTKRLVASKAPQVVISKSSSMVDRVLGQLIAVGITQEELQAALGDRFMDYEREEMEASRMESCLHSLRHNQKTIYEDSMEVIGCKERGTDCFHCSEYQEATQEQMVNYYHGCDIDTGEKLPDPPGLKELKREFGELDEEEED